MKLSRRELLNWGLAGVGLAVAEKAVGSLSGAAKLAAGGGQVSRTSGVPRRAIASTCLACPARCGILCFVEQGRLMKIEGNPRYPSNLGRLCSRGQAGLNVLYDPERITRPRERAGPRGSGKWREISWEEALQKLGDRLQRAHQEGRAHEVMVESGTHGRVGPAVTRFLRAFGAPEAILSSPPTSPNKAVALRATWGADTDVNDVACTKYLLNFGANPYESHPNFVGFAQRIAAGRASGARLVTFDPRLSNTAGRSDEWFPLRPGTDGLVALAMAHVIVRDQLYDAAFIQRWVNYPIAELARHLQGYTPEFAERISGVSARDIERIAREYALTKPATTLSGGGVSEHENGVQNERCVALLNALTGNVDVRGGYCLPRTYPLPEVELLAEDGADEAPPARGEDVLEQVAAGGRKLGVYLAHLSNPVYSHADTARITKLLQDENAVPYLVVVDTHLTETADLADLVLPTTTYLESWGLESPPSPDLRPLVSICQPAVAPVEGTRSLGNILLGVVEHVGPEMRRALPLEAEEDYLSLSLRGLPKLAAAGGMAYLQQRGVWADPAAPAYRSYERSGFRTPSGKFEVHSATLAKLGAPPLPSYEPTRGHAPRGKEQLALITFQWNVHTTGGDSSNCKWLTEITHNDPLYINPDTAQQLGIAHGDTVEVTSPIGKLITKAHYTEGIHPEVVAMGDSCGHWRMGRVAQAKSFNSADPDTALLWWGEIGNGQHPNRIIPVARDPVGGGQAWMDTIVTVRKVSA